MDETMINLYDPRDETRIICLEKIKFSQPIKAKVTKSAAKVMFIFFLDSQGMLLVHPAPEGQTVNAGYYSKVLRRYLVRAIQKKRPGRETEQCILHQDNAPPHTAKSTIINIDFNIGFQQLTHASYSSELAPCDFAIFPRLKRDLRGIRHDSHEHLIQNVNSIVRSYDRDLYEGIFKSWVKRHEKNTPI